MNNNYIVYCHTNKINNKKYIGITKQNPNDRWRRNGIGYKAQKKFYQAILKYGWDNFLHDILYEKLSCEEACLIEKRLIKEYDTIRNGYNIEYGGQTNQHSPETIEKIKNAMIGKKHSLETIKNIKEIKQNNSGKQVMCLETKEIFPSFGEASINKKVDKTSISRCCKGKQAQAGGYHWALIDDNHKPIICEKIDKRKKGVVCINTGKKYSSVSDAAKETKSDASNIIKVCNGKYKTTNGLKWKWEDK